MPALYPYPAYKPSGVEWLGYVPEYWDLVRLKYAVQINPETLSEDTDPEYLFDYMDINSVGTGYMATPPVRQVFGNAPSRARRVFRQGDTAVSTVRTYLRAAYHLERDWPHLIASTGFAVLRPPKTIVPALLGHIVQSDAFVRQVVTNSVGVAYPAISETRLDTLFLVLPPLQEQTSIVRYLHYVDRRIRQYVSTKRKLITLLDEERQAIVNQAVTRGLDPNVRLKPSGVEWLGDVPEHWETTRFSRQVDIAEGQVDPEIEPYSSMLLIAPNHLESKTGRLLYRETASEQAAISGKYFCLAGDVIYSKIRPALAKVLVAPADCLCSADMYPLRPRNSLLNVYLFWLMLSEGFTAWSVLESDRVAMPKINRETLTSLHLPIPPLSEQAAIVQHLDEATAIIYAAIARARRQIELVQEYRTRLMADVVTGKLDVREAVAQLPDEADNQDPIEESGPLADGMDEDPYDADNFREELAMESEVTA